MPKINVDCSYLNHPKTRRLKLYLDPQADIYPIRLWIFCAEYFYKEGVLTGYSGSEIEGILGYTGHPGNLIRALETVGFIIKVGENFAVKDWREHAGFIWDYKKAGKHGAIKRWKSRKSKRIGANSPPISPPIKDPNAIELNGIELNRDKRERRFEKPTALAVAEYAQALGFSLDGQKFWDYYESKGWVIGKSPMKSWQAAVRTWIKREQQNGQNAGGAFDWQTTKLIPRT